MSYILDALKRAEAERERGQVPGLNAQPVPVAAASGSPRRLGLWLGVLCGTALGTALIWSEDSQLLLTGLCGVTIVGLIGTNGAGKSTLMNAVGGFCPSEGTVELFGEKAARSASARARPSTPC